LTWWGTPSLSPERGEGYKLCLKEEKEFFETALKPLETKLQESRIAINFYQHAHPSGWFRWVVLYDREEFARQKEAEGMTRLILFYLRHRSVEEEATLLEMEANLEREEARLEGDRNHHQELIKKSRVASGIWSPRSVYDIRVFLNIEEQGRTLDNALGKQKRSEEKEKEKEKERK
jgi:hypothetical protein